MRFFRFVVIQRPYRSPCRSFGKTSTPPQTSHDELSTQPRRPQSTSHSIKSMVQIGTSYEHQCAQTLLRLGFTGLIRTGGRSDRGIDLLGHWLPPSLSPADGGIPVVIQCKATARKPGPDIIRELEGAVVGAPGDWNSAATIGVLCAKKGATDGVRQAVRRSRRGVVWVMVEDSDASREGSAGEEGRRGRVKQLFWNEAVGSAIGDRMGAGLRYVPGDKGMEKELYLTVDGKVWEPKVERTIALGTRDGFS